MKGRASAELGCLNQYLTTTLGCLVGTVQQASREISSCRIGHLPPQVSSLRRAQRGDRQSGQWGLDSPREEGLASRRPLALAARIRRRWLRSYMDSLKTTDTVTIKLSVYFE